MEKPIRVVLADDHPIVHEGFRDVCEYGRNIDLVGVAANSEQTRKILLELQPDILLLDIYMPGDAASETILFAHHHCPHTKILMFSAFCNLAQIQQLRSCGINGYVLKSEEPNTLLAAIRAVASGGFWYSKAVLSVLGYQRESKLVAQTITQRESQILGLISKGYDNQKIADELCIAKQTVANYISCIYEKLNVTSRAEAILWQIENQLN